MLKTSGKLKTFVYHQAVRNCHLYSDAFHSNDRRCLFHFHMIPASQASVCSIILEVALPASRRKFSIVLIYHRKKKFPVPGGPWFAIVPSHAIPRVRPLPRSRGRQGSRQCRIRLPGSCAPHRILPERCPAPVARQQASGKVCWAQPLPPNLSSR